MTAAAWTKALEPELEQPRAPSVPRQPRKVDGNREEKRRHAYVEAALLSETESVRNAGKGTRNHTLNRAAFALGQFVGAGLLDRGQAEQELADAAAKAGLGKSETQKTIASGLDAGEQEPRELPPPEERVTGDVSYDDLAERFDDFEPGNDGEDGPDTTDTGSGKGCEGLAPGPCADEPLRGLKHLPAVALTGRERILSLAATSVMYVWQDIVVSGTTVVIAGPPAEGKTTLLFLILAARMNHGEPTRLLERELLPAPAGKFIVLIEGEHSESSTARKLVRSLRILGLDDTGLDRVIIVARKAVVLGSPEWRDIETMVAADLVSDIALDTVARVAPAEANDEREQVAIFSAIARTIERAPDGREKPVVWAVAHTRKNGTDGGLGDVSGSVQRVGQADTVLLIKGEKVEGETVSTKVTFGKLREDPDVYPKPVSFSLVKQPDGSATMRVGLEPAADARPLEERILELLAAKPRTKTSLGTALGRSNADVDVAISNLFASRQITTSTVVINGRGFRGFELRRAPDEAPDEPSSGRAPDEHRTNHEPA